MPNRLVKQLLGESTALPVVIGERAIKIHLCPHCKQEILEKHSYCKDGRFFHSDCSGEIIMPPPSEAELKWLENFKKG